MADSSTKPASSMAELMARSQKTFKTFHRGDQVEGTVTKLTPNEVLVDIDAKSEAVVLEKDKGLLRTLLKKLKVGDTVTVTVLSPEAENGVPVVSLRRFMEDAAWEILESAQKEYQQIPVTVSESTKGGFLATTESGMSGFLPNSHIAANSAQQPVIGKVIQVSLLELNRKENKILFSQKSSMSPKEFEEAAKQYPVDKKIIVSITNITPFGMFVSLPLVGEQEGKTLDGLIHISEIAWEKVMDISTLYSVGDEIEVIIIGKDSDSKRIDLSIKRLTDDPFEAVMKKFPLDTKVTATVTSVDETGVHLDLESGVEGIIRKDKIPPTVSYEVGQSVEATVSEVDGKRHRILLVPVLREKPLMYR